MRYIQYLCGSLLIAVTVGLFSYGVVGVAGLLLGLTVAFVTNVYVSFIAVRKLKFSLELAFIAGNVAALIAGCGASYTLLSPLTGGFVVFLGVGAGFGFFSGLVDHPLEIKGSLEDGEFDEEVERLAWTHASYAIFLAIGLAILGYLYVLVRLLIDYNFITQTFLWSLIGGFIVITFLSGLAFVAVFIGLIIGIGINEIWTEISRWFISRALVVLLIGLLLYILLGFLFASAYKALDRYYEEHQSQFLYQSPFCLSEEMDTHAESSFEDFAYFSFKTLTRVGNTDIVPCSRFAKILEILETILGLFLIAIVLNRAYAFGRQ